MRPDDHVQSDPITRGEMPATGLEPPPHSAHSDSRPVWAGSSPASGRRIGLFAAIAAIVLATGFPIVHFFKASQQKELASTSKAAASSKSQVNVVIVRSAERTRPLTLPGETAAWFESTIYVRVNGYVAKWNVDIGDHVRQGQILAIIDTPELDADLNAARAALTAARAQVKVREAEAEFARGANERWRDSPKGVVAEQDRESKRADYDAAVANLNAAVAQVALEQAKVDRLVAVTRFKRVVAPYDGTITERRVDIGNLVTAGSVAGNTPLYRMSQDNPMRVYVDVPQSAAGDLMKPGVSAQVRMSNRPDWTFNAKIARTAKAINPQARTLRVEVDIPNPDQGLVPGMYVNVSFDLQSHNLMQVPAAALVFRSSGPEVVVVDGTGRVHFRKVAIARDEGTLVELASGVAPGDKVALNISSLINDGDIVVVNEPAAAPATADPKTTEERAN